MPRNIEIKARVAVLATCGPTLIHQDDTFFSCPNGRLKLRTLSPDAGELIFYQRPDSSGPKSSFYVRSPTTQPDSLRDALTLAWGQARRVIKQRTLYLIGRTRVHLDRVHGLGDFMELEVVLADGEAMAGGLQEAQALTAQLGIQPEDLVDCAYVDLLAALTQLPTS
jgi:adenylate cyclase class IV